MGKIIKISAVVLRNDEGKFLLVQEGKPKAYGLWNLPAGYVDPGETATQAAVREVHEETGYVVILDSETPILEVYKPENERHFIVYKGVITGGTFKVDGVEILDAQWYTYQEIQDLADASKLRAPFVYDAIQQCNT